MSLHRGASLRRQDKVELLHKGTPNDFGVASTSEKEGIVEEEDIGHNITRREDA
eukprot:CAMPEP_0181236704 /NCGR_PEP_ID=MMETSP1096-20121128/38334_1 /TAXON_ID=156174 ORGANISM="Chrysochromulina ericina, Strain CCMP281" /NCGR_SAMPLE_ID=MMETSP1096 /ASSEMBLY_ACC=CAM_ASM_000453 /LENGTH=53 /DNA_ID=CAMNT_0023331935 /DNA_START=867 /DNA_END=1024 /DNA_ORIENTATION=-